MIWVLDHPRDLGADFRAFYHLSPEQALELDTPEYLALAHRAPAYAGVMAARIAVQEQQNRKRKHARQVADTPEAIAADPLLGAAISFG